MKRKTILFSVFALSGIFLSYDAITNSAGAPVGTSGSPASNGKTCAQSGCHSGPALTTQSITISSTVPSSGFLPNTDYTITVQADAGTAGSPRIGFEASIEDANGHAGTLTAGSGNKKVGNFITHTSAGTSSSNNSNSWNFIWNSGNTPADAEVYVAANFTNQNGTTTGDVVTTQTLTLTKAGSVGIEEEELAQFTLSPNPAYDWVEINGMDEVESIKIFDLQGRFIKEVKREDNSSAQSWKIDISGLKAGHYLLAADGEKGLVQTLVVE